MQPSLVPPSLPRWDLDYNALADNLAPLASATRLRLLNFLTAPRYLEEIASFLIMNRSAAKKHVDQLLEAGFVEKAAAQRTEGLVVEYRLAAGRIFEVFDAMRSLGTLQPTGATAQDPARTKAEAAKLVRVQPQGVPRLVVLYAIEVGATVLLLPSGKVSAPWVLGRDAACTVRLTGDSFVSARHAQVEASGAGYTLTDLFSTNGTFLDWERLKPGQSRRLENGQVVGVGKTILLFRDR